MKGDRTESRSQREKPEAAPGTAKPTPNAGAELTYNRRNRFDSHWPGSGMTSQARTRSPFASKKLRRPKVYPKPDYKAMIDAGMPRSWRTSRSDSIAMSPQTRRGAVPTDDDIKSYIAGVNRVMDATVTKWAGDADRAAEWLLLALVARRRARTVVP